MEDLEEDLADFCKRHNLQCAGCFAVNPTDQLRTTAFTVVCLGGAPVVPGTELAMLRALSQGCETMSSSLRDEAAEVAAEHDTSLEADNFFDN